MTDFDIPFAHLARAYETNADAFDESIRQVHRSGHYILGPRGAALEEAVADYLDVSHAVGVGSGTDALKLAIIAAGIGPGDEVITTPFTFAATVQAIEYAGAIPVLVDIDANTLNIDPALAAAAVTENTKALLPVHLFGQPANMRKIMEIAHDHDLIVIEDCAQSMGSTIDGKSSGSIGLAGAFSFYPSKTLGCFGDGGMVVTNDANVNAVLRQLRHHGNNGRGEHVMLGFNSRLDECHAAVLEIKLPQLEDMNSRRRVIGEHYDTVFSSANAELQQAEAGVERVYGYYTLAIDNRDGVRKQLQNAGIASAIYYARPLHQHAHFSDSCRYSAMPVSENVSARCLSLPIFPEMTDAEIDYVASTTLSLIL